MNIFLILLAINLAESLYLGKYSYELNNRIEKSFLNNLFALTWKTLAYVSNIYRTRRNIGSVKLPTF